MSSIFRRPRPAAAARTRLNLEPLEAREVPATFTVTTLTDEVNGSDNQLSLREAINAVNASPDPTNTINFAPNLGGVLTVGNGTGTSGGVSIAGAALPTITKQVSVVGLGANVLTIQNAPSVLGSVFSFAAPVGTAESLSGLTISGGQGAAGTSTVFTPTGGTAAAPVVTQPSGGGVTNNGSDLTLSAVEITGNASASAGGGVLNISGNLTILNSTIASNSASVTNTTTGPSPVTVNGVAGTQVVTSTGTGNGGGIEVLGGSLSLVQDTIAGNTAAGSGGGVDLAAAASRVNAGINNSTISANTATGIGGGINITPGTPAGVGPGTASASLTLSSTIVAGNTGGGGNNDVSGSPLTGNNNLIGSGTGLMGTAIVNGSNGNQVGTANAVINPMLGPLTNNGGPTRTLLPQTGSPAIDKGAANGLTTDQRGFGPRVVGVAADVGSVEVGATAATPNQNALINQLVIANFQRIFAQPLPPQIAFAVIAALADVNGDGFLDVVTFIGLRVGSGSHARLQIFKIVFDGLSPSGATIGGIQVVGTF